jgi:DNA-binding CsgD family transcriptional regulator
VPAAASLAQSARYSVGTGDPGAVAELEEAMALAREAGAAEAEAVALTNLTHALGNAGRLEESVALALEGAERCRRLGLERGYGLFLEGNACEMLVILGRFDEAQELVDRGLHLAPEGLTALHLHSQRGAIALERGDAETALQALERAAELGVGAGDYFVAMLELQRAEAFVLAGRAAEASEAASAALDAAIASDDLATSAAAARCGLHIAADRAEAARARHDVAAEAAARADGEGLWERLTAGGVGDSPLALAELETARGERTRLAGDPDPEAWAAAATAWRVLSAPARAAAADLRRGEALLQVRAPRQEIGAALAAAYEVAHALGAGGLEREAARLAARARVSLPRHDGAAPPAAPAVPPAAAELGVTPRELEVLGLVAAGRTNQQIADELVISVKTAGIHVSSLLRKLGVGNRSEAGAVALRAGLVDDATLDRLLG